MMPNATRGDPMKPISKEEYLSAYRSQLPISLVQMALAISLGVASVLFHDRIGWIFALSGACLAARLGRWLYIRPKIAGRLLGAGKPAQLLFAADMSFVAGTALFGGALFLNWMWNAGWNGLLGVAVFSIAAGLPLAALNRKLRVALRDGA